MEGDTVVPPRLMELLNKVMTVLLLLVTVGSIVLVYVVIWTAHINPLLLEKTFVGENSLLPVIANSRLDEDSLQLAKVATEVYFARIENLLLDVTLSSDARVKQLAVTVIELFKAQGVECYIQEFEVYAAGETTPQKGYNVYAMVKGQRADGAESLLLTGKYGFGEDRKEGLVSEVGAMLTLATSFSKMNNMGLDVIFLLADVRYKEQSHRAYLGSYFNQQVLWGVDPILLYAQDVISSGTIRASVHVELKGCDRVMLAVEGAGGQLPNSDYVVGTTNVVRRWASQHPIFRKHAIFDRTILPYCKAAGKWLGLPAMSQGGRSLLSMGAYLASGVPSGLHGVASGYDIEAITLRMHTKRGRCKEDDMLNMLQLIEAVPRFMNNPDEPLHRAFYLYFLVDENWITISKYIFVLAVSVSPLVLRASSLYFLSPYIVSEGEWKFFFLSQAIAYTIGMLSFAIPILPSHMQWIGIASRGELALTWMTVMVGGLAIYFLVVKGLLHTSHISLQAREKFWAISLGPVLGFFALNGVTAFAFSLVQSLWMVPLLVLLKPTQSRARKLWQWGVLVALSPVGYVGLHVLFRQRSWEDTAGDLLVEWSTYGSLHFPFLSLVVLVLAVNGVTYL